VIGGKRHGWGVGGGGWGVGGRSKGNDKTDMTNQEHRWGADNRSFAGDR